MIRSIFTKSIYAGMAVVLSMSSLPAFAGMATITPNFKLANIQNDSPPAAANLEISCGIAGKVKFCYDITQGVSVTDIKIFENKLSFNFGVIGSCKNFDTNHFVTLPRMKVEKVFPLKVKTWSEEVKTRIKMEGQEYCIQRMTSAQVDVPTLLQGEATKRDHADRSGKEFAVKLDESSVDDWAPAIQLEVTEQFKKAEKKVTKDLDYSTPFAEIAQTIGNPKEKLSQEFNDRATPSDQSAALVAKLLKAALKTEFSMLLSADEALKFDFEENQFRKVFLQKSNNQMNILWF